MARKKRTAKRKPKKLAKRPQKRPTRPKKPRKKRQSVTGSRTNLTRVLHEIFGSSKKRDTAQKIMYYLIVFPFVLIINGFLLMYEWASSGRFQGIKLGFTIFFLTPFFFITVVMVYLIAFAIAFFPSIILLGIALTLFIHKFAWNISKRFEKWQKSTVAYKRRNPQRKLKPSKR